jgi:hypothetical protein
MQGNLELLPPVVPRQGHRRHGLLASGVVHIFVALIIFGGGGASSPTEDEPTTPPDKMVWTAPPSMPAMVVPPPEKPKPVAYAAAPVSGKKAEVESDSAGSSDNGSKWRDFLSRAVSLQEEGVSAPTYVIDNLSPALIATLTERGIAILVAGRPPFRDHPQQVVWRGTGAAELVALSQAWSRDVARRGVPLPRGWVTGIALAPAADVYLIPRAPLDLAILASQMEAAEARGIRLDAVRRTRGRLIIERDDVVAYRVETVDLRDRS